MVIVEQREVPAYMNLVESLFQDCGLNTHFIHMFLLFILFIHYKQNDNWPYIASHLDNLRRYFESTQQLKNLPQEQEQPWPTRKKNPVNKN